MRRKLALIASSAVLLAILLEAGLRAYEAFLPERVSADPELGWKGKKRFPDPASTRPRVFVLGDSYTHSVSVEGRALYTRVLGERAHVEVFAYAGNGYGTLQEYLAFERYADEVRPDVVGLQVAVNDFVNNAYALEERSRINSNHRARPYLEDGVVRLRVPSRFGWLDWARGSRLVSHVLYRLDVLLAGLARGGVVSSVEAEIAAGREPALLEQSRRVTGEILDRFRKRAGHGLLVAFPADQQDQVRTMLSESLRAVVSQRLLPRADGQGRVPAIETLIVTKAVANLIRENKVFQIQSILQTGATHGMGLLDQSIRAHVQAGTVSRETALRHCADPKTLAA